MWPDIVIRVILALFAGFFLFCVLYVYNANAADDDYCELWSREQTQIEVANTTDVDKATMTLEGLLQKRAKNFLWCKGADSRPQLEGLASEQAWATRTYSVMIARSATEVAALGTEPAKENPDDELWKAQCRAEYKTWDEDTGTVVRRGSDARVRCPCGTEVICGE